MNKDEFLMRFNKVMEEIEQNKIEYKIIELIYVTNKPIGTTVFKINDEEITQD